MAVARRFHPGCETARALRTHHEKEVALAKDLPGSRLFTLLEERRTRAYAEHDAECESCWGYARACLDCGVDLTTSPHRFRCVHNPKRWRKLFARRAPPLAHEARHRPRAIETPPPRAPPPPPAPARPVAAKDAAPAPPATRGAAPPHAAAKTPQPPPKPSPFEVLGLKPDATVSEIRSAYRDKAMEYHPDRVATLAPDFQKLAEQRMRSINEAYEALLRMAAKAR